MHASTPPLVQPCRAHVLPPRAVPSQTSPALITLLPQLLHEDVLSVHVDEQLSVPAPKPFDAQVAPPRLVPSHCSPESMIPLPHGEAVHDDVTRVHDDEQLSVPPAKPFDVQVAPPRLVPSHCSPESTSPLPQVGAEVGAKHVGYVAARVVTNADMRSASRPGMV